MRNRGWGRVFVLLAVVFGRAWAELPFALSVSEDTEDALLVGPGISHGVFSVYVNYVLSVTDAVSHGVEAGAVFEF